MNRGFCILLSQQPLDANYWHIHLQLTHALKENDPIPQLVELYHCQFNDSVCIPVMRWMPHNRLEGFYRIKDADCQTLSSLPENSSLQFTLRPTCYPQAHTENMTLVIAENEYLACAIRLVQIRRDQAAHSLRVLWSLDSKPPFKLRPSQFIIPGLAAEVIAGIPLLEDLKIPSRVACHDSPGCYSGPVLDLAQSWLVEPDKGPIQICVFGEKKFCEELQKELKL